MQGKLVNTSLFTLSWSVLFSTNVKIVDASSRNLQNSTPSFCAETREDVSYFCPVQRYCAWGVNDEDTTDSLKKNLKYDEESWNYDSALNVGIEWVAFLELKKQESSALEDIGFDEDSHDCCHGHYMGYDWSDFDGTDYDGVRAAWTSVGYDQTAWTLGLISEFDDYWWDELSDEQQSLLSFELCYTRELWNEISMTEWPEETKIPGSNETTDIPVIDIEPACHIPNPSFEYFCPIQRYCDWDTYFDNTTVSLENELFYDNSTWNYVTFNEEIEGKSYYELFGKQIEGLKALGYTGDSHDCCQVHYNVYDWSDFADSSYDGVRAALESIGYDETLWTLGVITDDADLFWDDLSDEQRAGLSSELCYSRETWNQVAIPDWPSVVDLPGARRLEGEIVFTSQIDPTLTPSSAVTDTPTGSPTESPTLASTTSAPTESPTTEIVTPAPTPETSQAKMTESTVNSTSQEEVSERITDEPTMSPTTSIPIATDSPTSAMTSTPTLIITSTPSSLPTSKITGLPTGVPTLSPTISAGPTKAPINISENLTPCRELDEKVLNYCPTLRYCVWESQTVTASDWLTNQLGYDRTTWNLYSKNPIEISWFEDLPSANQRDLENLGFDLDVHECCMNHYELYGWRMFDRWNMTETKAAWETLGYDQEKWDNGLATQYDDLWFDELPDNVQFALTEHLCYTEELWNEVPLDFWPDDAIVPGTYDIEEVEVPTTVEPPTVSTQVEETSAAFVPDAKFIFSATLFAAVFSLV